MYTKYAVKFREALLPGGEYDTGEDFYEMHLLTIEAILEIMRELDRLRGYEADEKESV